MWQCPNGEIGRRSRLKICRCNSCAGSSPASGTNIVMNSHEFVSFFVDLINSF